MANDDIDQIVERKPTTSIFECRFQSEANSVVCYQLNVDLEESKEQRSDANDTDDAADAVDVDVDANIN